MSALAINRRLEASGRETRPWGVNVIGYLDAELGVGEAARQLIAALDAQQIPVAPTNRHLPNTRTEHPFAHTPAPNYGPFAVNVICENAVAMPAVAEHLGEGFFAGRYTIGMWFWEVSAFPERWDSCFEYLDEVWVASDHVAEAVRARAPVPVTKVALPVVPAGVASDDRSRLELPDGICFLFAFDYNSVLERKNPLGLIEAFRRAFPTDNDASLVLKTTNAERNPADSERVRRAAAQHPRVHVLEGFLAPQEKNAMIAACDCYVSLHRSEGFGLTLAEAMYFDRPVIATDYSGNLDFMTPENSYLVEHGMCAIGPGADPYPAAGEWADPDIDQAAALMRRVHDHPGEARERGRRAGRQIRETRSPEAAGRMIGERLERVRELEPRARPRAQAAVSTVGSAPALSALRELLSTAPQRPARLGGARRLLRRLALRLMQPHTVHQHELDRAILEALEEAGARCGQALAEVERALGAARLRSETDWAATLAALRRLERRVDGERYPSSERGSS